jgi:uncharacterized protein YqeY
VLQQLQQDLLQAMKAKDATKVGALRLLLSSVKNRQIDLGHELNNDEFLAVVAKEIKQRRDSIEQFTAAGRQDLVANEQAEMDVIRQYLPAQLDESAIAQHVDQAITQTQATSVSDMGKVMTALSHLKGQADMAQVSTLVKQKLQG